MAVRTWLGSMAPLAQAEPAEAATPSSSSTTSRASLSTPSISKWQWPGARCRPAAVSCAPGTLASRPPASRPRKSPDPLKAPVRSAAVVSRAAAIPTMPATLCVPARRSRSCGPP